MEDDEKIVVRLTRNDFERIAYHVNNSLFLTHDVIDRKCKNIPSSRYDNNGDDFELYIKEICRLRKLTVEANELMSKLYKIKNGDEE